MNPQANNGQDQGKSQSQGSAPKGQQVSSETAKGQGLSNLAYNLITMLAKKAKGAEAYEAYLEDARASNSPECVALIEKIKQDDLRHIEELKGHMIAALTGGDMPGGQAGRSGQAGQSDKTASQSSRDEDSIKAQSQGRH